MNRADDGDAVPLEKGRHKNGRCVQASAATKTPKKADQIRKKKSKKELSLKQARMFPWQSIGMIKRTESEMMSRGGGPDGLGRYEDQMEKRERPKKST